MARPGSAEGTFDQDEFVDIRLSDLLRDCAVGAIVRHDRHLAVVQDTRYWDGADTHPHEREIRYVELVRRSLDLENKKLCRPPVRTKQDSLIQGWIRAWRFPEWTRCTRCGLLHHAPWRKRGPGGGDRRRRHPSNASPRRREVYRCKGGRRGQSCGGTLEQIPWVMVHRNGYLADVPWHALAHEGTKDPKRKECRLDRGSPYLQIKTNSRRQRIVKCHRCGAYNQIRIPRPFPFGRHTRPQPWVPERPFVDLEEPAWLLGVNDVRIHFPQSRTALVIPPESRIPRGTVVDRLYSSSADRKKLEEARTTDLARKGEFKRIAENYGCKPPELEDALERIEAGYPAAELEFPAGGQFPLEYKALTEPIEDPNEDEDFLTEHHSVEWRRVSGQAEGDIAQVAACVDRLVAVHRVKTIMVHYGFRRVSPDDSTPLVPPDIVQESDWLPAIELWGEGLFFTLDETLLRPWERLPDIRERAMEFARRVPPHVAHDPTPRFLLCHTLAHLLIRRLETEAGYPAASLRERIYCAEDDDAPMAGILIHVAVPDEHGSLGGLMEMARPDRFLRLLARAVEDAEWCSFDPVCAEQEARGPDLLNRAACHACALVPEPSCICGNRLLDRVFVTGDGEQLPPLWNMEEARD